jgi:aminocarboxymuconate-semialdehyde decarboxylase
VDGCIDVHAHAVPLPLLRELEHGVCGFSATRTDAGWVVDVPGVGKTRPVGARMTDTFKRNDWMASAGIDTQILSPWMDVQVAPLPAGIMRDWLRRLNDAMATEAAASGPHIRAMASVAIHDGDNAASDLVEAIDDLGLAGLCLTTSPSDGRALSDASFEPLWAAVAERGIPVMLHPPTIGPSNDLRTLAGLGNVYGRLIDTSVAVADLILSGLLDRFPGLRILLVHGGGFVPYQIGRLDGGYRSGESKRTELQRGAPSDYLDAFYYDTVALSSASIRMLVDTVGADRVTLGTDFPFPIGDPAPVQTVDKASLSPAHREAVLHGTAHDLFGTSAEVIL